MILNPKSAAMAAILMAAAGTLPAAAQTSEEPIITFHTTVYENTEEENAFHIILGAKEDTWVDIDFGFGTEEVKVSQAIFNQETGSIDGTWINGSVSSEGVVKIYGDPTLIDYIDMQGCYITDISFPQLTEVEVLDLEYNNLQELDLSHMTKLQALYLTGNPFTRSPLVIGGEKPDLTILEMSIIDNLDPEFDIAGYPNLMSFEAWHVPGLTHLDPTNCPGLMRISIDLTSVSTLDVSKNPNLLILNIGQTNITEIDLSHNPYLTEFYCTNAGSFNHAGGLTSIDLSHNPYLQRLGLGYNNLTDIDLSPCPKLQYVQLRNNLLTALDITANPDINILDLTDNRMGFSTIPADRETFTEYYYSQLPLEVEASYKEGTTLDFTSFLNRPNSTTTASLISYRREAPNDPVELGNEYYTYDNGKVTLLQEYPDSLYFTFRNSALPMYPMTTEKFMVKNEENFGKDNAVVKVNFSSLRKDLALSVGIAGASAENPKTFSVDFGNGTLETFTATTSTFPAANVTGTRAGQTTTIYLHEGDYITSFGISQGRVTGIDLSEASSLRDLRINNVNLASIDLQWNGLLTYIDLSHNNLTSLDLTGANALYEKTMLETLILADNNISELTQPERHPLIHMDVSDNNFSEFGWTKYSSLQSLDISGNSLSEVNLQDMEALELLNLSHNNFTEVIIPDYVPLVHLDITNNDIPFGNLPPVGTAPEYIYAPQNEIVLPTQAPNANLNKEYYVDEAGQATIYTWKMASDGSDVEAGKITGADGYFKFADPELGVVYCEMSHPAFPDFSGENILKSTPVKTATPPTHVFASFKTTESQAGEIILAGKNPGTTIYIDWTGNGDFEQYPLVRTYTIFPVETIAGADVKCYSYGDDDEVTVFSISDIALEYMDASPMSSVYAFTCSAGLSDDKLTLPEVGSLTELNLSGNKLTRLPDLSRYENLNTLNISYNELEDVDISSIRSLRNFYAAANKLENVTLDNPALIDLALVDNKLAQIDLSGVPSLDQLFLSQNELTELDVTMLTHLNLLAVDRNRMTIATLPLPLEQYGVYSYVNQMPLDVQPENGVVDLSSEVSREGVASKYTWYLDTPYFNEDNELIGEELYEGEEYTIDNGVTTFLESFRNLVCVVTNPIFPNLYLYTGFLNVEAAAIEAVEIEADAEAVYYNLNGVRVAEPTDGIYIKVIGGKASKIMIKGGK